MEKWKLTSAAIITACSAEAQHLGNEPSAQDLYLLAKGQPSIEVPADVVQEGLHRHQCEKVSDNPDVYRCQVTVAYYLKSGDVLLDKQEWLLSWQDGQWVRQ